MGIESEITTLPYPTGCDYFIVNTCGSCGIQRKDAMKELAGQMPELRDDILPRLISFTENPVLLVEEDFTIGQMGNLFRRDPTTKLWMETGLHSLAYYGFLESVRMMGVDVVCTRNLEQSIWYMASMDSYLSTTHYPKHQKSYKPYSQALGILCSINGIGKKRAEQFLQHHSVSDALTMSKCEGLTAKQLEKLKNILRWK